MIHDLPAWFEIVSLTAMVTLLVGDLVYVARKPHVPTLRECATWVGVYAGLALLFAVALVLVSGTAPAGEFLAGWITEYSLSVDNLFVFIVLMARFSVPREEQQMVLMVGIIIALVLRGIFIVAGAAILASFQWVFYIFGVFLLYTAVKIARDGMGGSASEADDYKPNAFVTWLQRRLHVTDTYDGRRLRTVVDGRRVFTPMIIVFVAIGSTDLLFAMDSIPAVFGLTKDPFIVFSANLFALMGLRQLYFLLGGLLERLVFLPYGLAVILGFIGVKLVFEAGAGNSVPFINGGQPIEWMPEISTAVSLGVIVVTLVVTTVASLVYSNLHEARPKR